MRSERGAWCGRSAADDRSRRMTARGGPTVMRWSGVVGFAAVAVLGCGPRMDPAFSARMAGADQARSDVPKAVRLYDEAARSALRSSERVLAREAAAALLERAGDLDGAANRWAAIEGDSEAPEAERAAASLRGIALRAPSDAARRSGERAWLERFPGHALAPRVLREHLAASESDDARVNLLDGLLALPAARALAPWLRLEKARLDARAGRTAAAIDGFEALATDDTYPTGALFDDALDEGSRLALTLGDTSRALRFLDRAFDARETAWLIGSAIRPRFPSMFLRRARLQATPEAARTAYRAMVEAMPEAREAGEARFELGLLEAAAGEAGAACKLARDLESRDPLRLVARCAYRFCPSAGATHASEEACAALALRIADDRAGRVRVPFEP